MTRENTGIANVPMQKQMFAGKRAGGIVAFSGQDGSFVNALKKREEDERISGFERLLRSPAGVREKYDAIDSNMRKQYEEREKLLDDGSGQGFFAGLFKNETEAEYQARIAKNKERTKALADTYLRGDKASELRKTDQSLVLPDAKLREYYADITGNPDLTIEQAKVLERNQQEAGAGDRAIEKEAFAQEQLDKEAKQKKVLGRPEEEIVGLQDQIKEMADTSIAAFDKLGFDKPEKFDPSKFSTEALRTELQENGVNLNLLSEQASALAEEKLKLGKDKKEALAFFGLEAGLNILAGKDPNALVNIGAGAGKAIAPLRKELTRIKDQHNALRKEENALAKMENDQDMGIAKFSLKRKDAAEERVAKAEESYERTKATFIAQNTRTIASLRTGMAQAEATRASTEATQASRREITALRLATEKERAVNRALETLQKNLEYTQAPPEEKKKMEDAVRKRALSGFASSSSNNLTSKLDLSGFTDITP